MLDNIKNEFIKCLDNEIRLYNEILLLVTEERDVLIKNEEVKLGEIVEKQSKLLKEINLQESRRTELFDKLIEKDRKSESLRDRIEKIKLLILNISKVNSNNISLIKQGSNSVKTFLRLILGNSEQNSYSRNGEVKMNMAGSILVNKQI